MKYAQIYQGTTLLTTVGVADNYFLRLRGLIGRSAREIGGLLICPCNQVHTWFMSEPIDIVYLDRSGIILRIDRDIPAWKMLRAERKARKVLELPAGMTNELGLDCGTELCLKSQ